MIWSDSFLTKTFFIFQMTFQSVNGLFSLIHMIFLAGTMMQVKNR